jgi:hypothetical protein
MFPERFKGIESRMSLQVELKMAAIKCGHQLIVRTSKHVGTGGEREFSLQMVCGHGTTYDSRDRPTPKLRGRYQATSLKPMDKKDLCPFSITVFLQKSDAAHFPDRWFLSTCSKSTKSDCSSHKNHFEFDPSYMHIPIGLMTEEEKRLAKDCGQLHFTPTSSSALLSLRQKSGLNWKPSQVDYISRQDKEEIQGLSCCASTADNITAKFQKR